VAGIERLMKETVGLVRLVGDDPRQQRSRRNEPRQTLEPLPYGSDTSGPAPSR
jgi:hypothetical protein